MPSRRQCHISCVLALAVLTASIALLAPAAADAARVLARVADPDRAQAAGIGQLAVLRGPDGAAYGLAVADEAALAAANVAHRVLAVHTEGEGYLLASRPPVPGVAGREAVADANGALWDDGEKLVLPEAPGAFERLKAEGWLAKRLPDAPAPVRPALSRPASAAASMATNSRVAAMVAAMNLDGLMGVVNGLSGAAPLSIEGAQYTFFTRHTASGEPIEKAMSYVQEQLASYGLSVSSQSWVNATAGYSGRNVIGELRGVTAPGEVVVFCAHVDSTSARTFENAHDPVNNPSPGADDNGSSVAALLMAASIMRDYAFDRTIRFVFFTGEEEDRLGSQAYAKSLAGQNIVGAYNMDMIAWNDADNENATISAPLARIHVRANNSDDMALAQVSAWAATAYGMDQTVDLIVKDDGKGWSDHSSFWESGYPALILFQDDYQDWNPHYHTIDDTVDKFDQPYFLALARIALASVAHIAGPALTGPTAVPAVSPAVLLLLLGG